ncbi:MAG TPA: radical SAM family heme chaperone HemW [Cyclobacteriaceae bacterium]|nr:radical SAM family heme chaperone HemW [Cyclobacteriaceae bacterium]
MPGLYFHIPFCKQACYYCDFHFSTNLSRTEEMVDAIAQELALQKNYLANKKLTSIYFGGGTPSLLKANHFEKIFNAIDNFFQLDAACEITLEANPDDLSAAQLNMFLAAGINRLSIGIQSFDDQVLKFLNRSHDSKIAITALENVRKAGFENFSLDLIYAIPGQNNTQLKHNIKTAIQFSPVHISAYSLTIEPKTVFGNWVSKKKLTPVEETINAGQFELISNELTEQGYEHYEISNYSKPGYYSRHNSSYWKQTPYLGIGPSAHSYNRVSRQFNISNNAVYIKSIQNSEIPFQLEMLTKENKINEYVFTTLRTMWGCNLELLMDEYQFDLMGQNKAYLDKLIQQGMVTLHNNSLSLTKKGKLLADQISLDLMV